MTQHPENSDPIASAGQIDDPDQPTTMKGQDDSRAGRDTQPDESATDGDPDQPGTSRHAASAPLSLIHISEPTRREWLSRMPSSA